jgi:predicted transcriptional regulator
MRDEQKVWQIMSDTSSTIFPLAQDIMRKHLEEQFTERRFYTPILVASGLAPNPISVDIYSKRNPYGNPNGFEKLFADMATTGYLDHDGNGGYQLSKKGMDAINSTNETFYNQINNVNRLSADKRKELSALLSKLVVAATEAELANGSLCLNISFNGHPKVEVESLAAIDQQIDDMFAFRDDSHISAWTPSGVDGHTWEVLSFVWNGEANTVEKLVERLPFRNYNAEVYTRTLDELSTQGWIEPGDDGYVITETGRKIREDAETVTNENFFAPWKSLSDDELAKLDELLNELKGINQKIVEENKSA